MIPNLLDQIRAAQPVLKSTTYSRDRAIDRQNAVVEFIAQRGEVCVKDMEAHFGQKRSTLIGYMNTLKKDRRVTELLILNKKFWRLSSAELKRRDLYLETDSLETDSLETDDETAVHG